MKTVALLLASVGLLSVGYAVANRVQIDQSSPVSSNVIRAESFPVVEPISGVVDQVPVLCEEAAIIPVVFSSVAFPADVMDAIASSSLAFPSEWIDSSIRMLRVVPASETDLRVLSVFASSVSAAGSSVDHRSSVEFIATSYDVDMFSVPGIPELILDPMVEGQPWPTECVLWNIHQNAYAALVEGDTNRFNNLRTTYWRMVDIAKVRATNTTLAARAAAKRMP